MSETLIGVAECRNVVVGCIIDVGDYVSDVVDLKKQIESRIRSIKKQRPSQVHIETISVHLYLTTIKLRFYRKRRISPTLGAGDSGFILFILYRRDKRTPNFWEMEYMESPGRTV